MKNLTALLGILSISFTLQAAQPTAQEAECLAEARHILVPTTMENFKDIDALCAGIDANTSSSAPALCFIEKRETFSVSREEAIELCKAKK